MAYDLIRQKIAAALFAAAKPLSAKELAAACDCPAGEIRKALEDMEMPAPFAITDNGKDYAIAVSAEFNDVARAVAKQETAGELTKPSLETLSIVAFRGPVAKADIERIRGVNASLILRNLMMRGLVERIGGDGEGEEDGATYVVSPSCLAHLGVAKASQLPGYETYGPQRTIEDIIGGKAADAAQS